MLSGRACHQLSPCCSDEQGKDDGSLVHLHRLRNEADNSSMGLVSILFGLILGWMQFDDDVPVWVYLLSLQFVVVGGLLILLGYDAFIHGRTSRGTFLSAPQRRPPRKYCIAQPAAASTHRTVRSCGLCGYGTKP